MKTSLRRRAEAVAAIKAPSSEVYLGVVAVVVAAATPVLAYLGNLGFAPLVGLAGVACLPHALRRGPAPLGYAILLALLAWALLSLAWSPATPHEFATYKSLEQFTGLKLVLQLAFYGAFVMAMQRVDMLWARRAMLILGVGLGLAMTMVLVEALRGAEIYQAIKAAAHEYTRPDLARRNVARSTYAAALLIWPAGLVMQGTRFAMVTLVLALATVVSAMMLNVDAPLVALVAGVIGYAIIGYGGRGGAWLLVGAVLVYFAATPVMVMFGGSSHPALGSGGVGKASWAARAEIWRFVAARIAQHPFRGWGLDASRVFPHVIPLHPHDAALQIWLELGAPGAALSMLFFGWLTLRIADLRQRDAPLAACAAASMTAYLTIGALSFGVWQEWWLGMGAIALAAVALTRTLRQDRLGNDGLAPLTLPEPSRAAPEAV